MYQQNELDNGPHPTLIWAKSHWHRVVAEFEISMSGIEMREPAVGASGGSPRAATLADHLSQQQAHAIEYWRLRLLNPDLAKEPPLHKAARERAAFRTGWHQACAIAS